MPLMNLEGFFLQYADFHIRGDAHGLMTQFTEKAIFWEACGSDLHGREEILGWFKFMFSRWEIDSMEYNLATEVVREDLVCCANYWNVRCCEKGSEQSARNVIVRATYALRLTEDGLKIWHLHSGV
ncbi:nuclear transport factor 2 family protein [Endozoicomonas atrinae]|nr:nuclear transport factor 2 family protein [Endozoicomonas atrinae]